MTPKKQIWKFFSCKYRRPGDTLWYDMTSSTFGDTESQQLSNAQAYCKVEHPVWEFKDFTIDAPEPVNSGLDNLELSCS